MKTYRLQISAAPNIKTLTIVADSAMLSKINLASLVENNLNYIVGARLASLSRSTLDSVLVKIENVNKGSIRLDNLIVDYSSKRYTKDKKDLDKAIARAEKYLRAQTLQSPLQSPRIKFLKTENLKNSLNQDLIDKHTKLCGLKGYSTNLDLPNDEVIGYYHNLYKVEHAWRIAKSDLEARPIYHYKESSIKNHIMICFCALAMSLYLELKNGVSTARVVHMLKKITDGKIYNKITGKTFFERVDISDAVKKLEKMSYE